MPNNENMMKKIRQPVKNRLIVHSSMRRFFAIVQGLLVIR